MSEIKIGDRVKWLGNRYTILKITSKGVVLKQNFSIFSTLKGLVPIEELSLIKK